MFGVLKGIDSERMYTEDFKWPQKSLNRLLNNNEISSELIKEYEFEVPITSYFTIVDSSIALLTNFVLYVFCLLIFLAYIVSN